MKTLSLLTILALIAGPSRSSMAAETGAAAADSAASVAALPQPSGAPADKVLIRISLRAGQKASYRITVENRETSVGVQTTGTLDSKGRPVPGKTTFSTHRSTTTTRMGLDVAVEAQVVSPEGGGALTCRLTNFVLPKLRFGDYDARHANVIRTHCTTILGLLGAKTFTLKVAPNGKVTEAPGFHELFGVVSGFYNPIGAATMDADKAEAMSLVGETLMWCSHNIYRDGLRFMRTLPTEPVGLASTWHENSVINAVPPIPVATNLTVTALDEAKLQALAKSVWPSPTPLRAPQAPLAAVMTGTEIEDLEFDRATGFLKRSLTRTYTTIGDKSLVPDKVEPRPTSKTYTSSTATVSALPMEP